MNGGYIAYHLRVNKHVDREIFFEAIDLSSRWGEPHRRMYVGLGGPFLADMRAAWRRFNFDRMVSIEEDDAVRGRQEFNRFLPPGRLQILKMRSNELLDEFSTYCDTEDGESRVVWLDFTGFDLSQQLSEFEQLVRYCDVGDLLRITLNTRVENFSRRSDVKERRDWVELVAVKAAKKLEQFAAPEVDFEEAFSSRHYDYEFSRVLSGCVHTAAVRGLESVDDHDPLLLNACCYADGQAMLTVTMAIADGNLKEIARTDSKFQKWDVRSSSWDDVKRIKMPVLSGPEQAAILREFDDDPSDEILAESGIPRVDAKENTLVVNDFRSHAHRYPRFERVL